MYKILFFDLDETLIAQELAFDNAYRLTAEWFARDVTNVDLDAFALSIPVAAESAFAKSSLYQIVRHCRFAGRDLLWGNPGAGTGAITLIAQSVETFRTTVWSSVICGLDIDQTRASEELSWRFRETMFSNLRVFPEVPSVLKRLANQYRLAIITNGMATAQQEKLSHLGLDGFFEFIISSAEIGEGKPSQRIFQAALDSAQVVAGKAMMIGDSLEGDIHGAQKSGLATVWLDRTKNFEPEYPGQKISSLVGWSPEPNQDSEFSTPQVIVGQLSS